MELKPQFNLMQIIKNSVVRAKMDYFVLYLESNFFLFILLILFSIYLQYFVIITGNYYYQPDSE